MNGKKERMALAATENANVWTSVREIYFTVEASNSEYEATAVGGELALTGAVIVPLVDLF